MIWFEHTFIVKKYNWDWAQVQILIEHPLSQGEITD